MPILLLAVAIAAQAPAPAPAIDGQALKTMAIEAVAAANGDAEAAVRALDEKVVARWGQVLLEPLSVSDAPTEIRLFSPYAAYRKSIAELVRRRQPVDRLAFNPAAIVLVAPVRVDAPDVTGINVRRNGEVVQPAANNLALRPITSPIGVTVNLHAGYVAFPLSAFAPGGDVTVIATLESGEPLTLSLDPGSLARFR